MAMIIFSTNKYSFAEELNKVRSKSCISDFASQKSRKECFVYSKDSLLLTTYFKGAYYKGNRKKLGGQERLGCFNLCCLLRKKTP